MKKSLKKFLFNFILTLMIISLIILVLYITYYFYVNKSYKTYEKNIDTIVTTIQKVNKDMYESSNNTYDVKKVSDMLSSKVKSLSNIKNKLNDLNPTEKYKNSFKYLNNGLNYNIKLYQHIYYLITNISNQEIEHYIENVKESRDNCIKNYSNFSKLNNKSSLNLEKEALNFIDKSINYSYGKIKEQKNKEITQSQISDFQEKLEDSLSQFTAVNNDYSTYLKDVRNNDMDYDDLINLISDDLFKVIKIKQNYYNLTIPKECIEIYDLFKKVIIDYESYAENFKYTLTIEKLKIKNKDFNSNTADSIYKTTNDKFLKFKDSYITFIDSYKIFKKNISIY